MDLYCQIETCLFILFLGKMKSVCVSLVVVNLVLLCSGQQTGKPINMLTWYFGSGSNCFVLNI